MMASTASCAKSSDNTFGPRVNVECRSFDFTLLFEDGLFITLPAVLFLLLIPQRLHFLRKAPVKLASYQLAVSKLVNS